MSKKKSQFPEKNKLVYVFRFPLALLYILALAQRDRRFWEDKNKNKNIWLLLESRNSLLSVRR